MYLVSDDIMERLIQLVPPGNLRLFAILGTSLKVQEMADVLPNYRVHINRKLRKAASELTGAPMDDTLYEEYLIDRTTPPTVYENKGFLEVYHYYKLNKDT